MVDRTVALEPDEAHATTEAAETSPAPATPTSPETTTGTTAAETPAPGPSRHEALARSQRSDAPSPESQAEEIERRRADLNRDSRRSPFDARRPYRNTSLENADVDPDVGWQGPAAARLRIFRQHHRTGNNLRFGTNEEEDDDDNDNDDNDEFSTEVEVTAEAQWALEAAGMLPVLSEYSDGDDDDDD